MSVVDVRGVSTLPTEESVVQFNWAYDGIPGSPYGSPVSIDCINTFCPEIDVVKDATLINGVPITPAGFSDAGDVITYEITVTNPGGVSLSNILVEDAGATTGPTYVSGDTNTNYILDAGETWIYEATYTTTVTDFINHIYTNTVSATGTPASGPDVQDTSVETVTAGMVGRISLGKGSCRTQF